MQRPDGSVTSTHSVFGQPWWLEAAAPGRWGEVLVRRGDAVAARLPYVINERFGVRVITHPPLTHTLGPWLRPLDGKYAKRLETEKDLMSELIAGLPRFDAFRQSFSPMVTNWLPFYWTGFSASVRYTYRIEGLSDLEAVRREFAPNVRRHIRKAERELEVRSDLGIEALLRLNRQTFRRQGLTPPYSEDLVRRLDRACAARGVRTMLFAVDAHDRTHAACFVVRDGGTAYLLLSGVDAQLRNSDAQTLLVWEAIRRAARVAESFDFAGSMVESIERFNRAFGARQAPYLYVERARPHIKPLMAIRGAARTWRRSRARRRAVDGP